jgi:hypothetical protein
MGRQINFWMTRDDERQFVARLRDDDVLWSPYALPFGAKPKLYELDAWKPIDREQRLVIIRRCDSKLLEYEHIAECELPEYDSRHPFVPWTRVGAGASPSIEWDSCLRRKGTIGRGRIYFHTDWLQGSVVRTKTKESTRWFDRLASWIRKQGRRSNGHFLLPGAAELGDAKCVEIN